MKTNLNDALDYEQSGDKYQPKRHTWLTGWARRFYQVLDLQAVERQEKWKMNAIERYRKRRIANQLEAAGLSHFDLMHPEARHLAEYLHPSERIYAAIRGRTHDTGSVLMVATSLRIIYLRLLPLISDFEEVPYGLVSGVSCNNIRGLWSSVTLDTRARSYEIDFIRPSAAKKFVDFIEATAIDAPDTTRQSVSLPARP